MSFQNESKTGLSSVSVISFPIDHETIVIYDYLVRQQLHEKNKPGSDEL